MPYAEKLRLMLKVSAFSAARLADEPFDIQSGDKNYLFYIANGCCTINALGANMKASQHMLIYFARNIHFKILPDGRERCLMQMLELSETTSEPCLDLQDLCIKSPAVDTFMGRKNLSCLLIDRENMYSTICDLIAEMEADQPEKHRMVASLLTVLFIKMARSFHLHGKPSGIQYITEAKRFIADHYSDELSVQIIADHLGISRSYIQILFNRYAKRNIVTHINVVRVDKAAYMLATTDMNVLDVALATGFNSRQHFTRAFREHIGLSPREYRKQRSTVKPERTERVVL